MMNMLAVDKKRDYIICCIPAAPLSDMRNSAGFFCFRLTDMRDVL